MDPPARKEKSKVKEPAFRVEKAKQKSAQQELKQRQRAEVRLKRELCMPEPAGEGAGKKKKTAEKTLLGVPACPQALVPPEVESPSRSQMVKWKPRVIHRVSVRISTYGGGASS